MLVIAGEISGTPKVWTWDGAVLTDLAAPVVGPVSKFMCLYQDKYGQVWAGDDVGGIHIWDGSVWTSLPAFTPKPIITILEYDDGVNGQMLYALTSDPCDHVGSPGTGFGLYFSNDGGATWNQVVGLPATILGATGMMVAEGPSGDILGICTHSIGFGMNGVWVNTAGGEAPVDSTVAGNWQLTGGGSGVPLKGHGSWFGYEQIGTLPAPAKYLVTDFNATTGEVMASSILYPAFPSFWTNYGDGFGNWLGHCGYGPHSALPFDVGGDRRLYLYDWQNTFIGYFDGTMNYIGDGDVPGAGVAFPTTAGEPVAFADDAGTLYFCYTPASLLRGYLIRRVADSNYVPDLSLPNYGFYDMITYAAPTPPNPERTPFDKDAEIHQGRIEPQEIDALEGDWCFVLGSEIFQLSDVEVGDSITLKTTWDFTATPLGYFGIYIRTRTYQDASTSDWQITATIAGTPWFVQSVMFERDFDPGWIPVLLPTGKVAGIQDIEFKLERI